jgi:NAD(P)-dependent dehydrogenase (short-subunit alcohol dehydrogenase family)
VSAKTTIPPEGWTIITGAGRGLGRALALELAAQGASICATDIDAEAARETAELAAQNGAPRTAHRRCDVTQLADFEDLAAVLGDEPVGMLINNAGVACGGEVGEAKPEDWRWSMDVNFFGAVHGCHVFVPRMRRQGRGLVVNIASAGGFLALPGAAPYSTAKAAVIALTESLAAELHATGVAAKVVCPVFLRTEIVEDGRFPDEQSKESGRRLTRQGRCPQSAARRIVALLQGRSVVIVPESEGRWLRRLKFSAPDLYLRLLAAARRRFLSAGSHPTT